MKIKKTIKVIKLTCLMLCLSPIIVYASKSYAETTAVSVNLSNKSVSEVLEYLEKETEFNFYYNNELIDMNRKVSVNVNSKNVFAILDLIFKDSDVRYKIVDKDVILTVGRLKATQQDEGKITGKVVDEKGEAIIGASVLVKGTNIGTVTDMDGVFSLQVGSNKPNIVISYIGYTQKTLLVEGGSIDVVLLEDAQKLDEVIVIGYGSVSKREVTSAVSHVSSKDFLNIGSNNPAMQIQGKVAGVSINNSSAADPNSSTSIQVRGVSSRKAGLGPLIVINGVPGGNLENINENDIESIDVLKDGAASAIYGTRGSNGVIVVTTKKGGGANGAVETSYNGYLSFDVVKKQLPVLSADEFRTHLPERGNDFGGNTDWFDELTKVGVTHNHALQISGGTELNNYRATVDVRDANGIDLRSNRKEIGARFSINHTDKNELYQIMLNVAPRSIDYNDSDHNVFSQAMTLNPTMPVMNPDKPNTYYRTTGWDANNPVEKLRLEKKGGERKYLDWDGTFKLNILPLFAPKSAHTLSTQVTLAQQLKDHDFHWFRPSTSTVAIAAGRKGEASQEKQRYKQESLEWLGNYGFRKNGHNFKAMVGYSYQYFMDEGLQAENKDFPSDALMYNKLSNGTYMKEVEGRLGMSSFKNDSKLIAFFGRLSYDFHSKYLVTASLRYEGSSKFGLNNKWGYFPAISAGWRISEEAFLSDIAWIDDFKIRADYGVTGNQDFDNYKSLSTMNGYGEVYYNGRYYQGWSPNVNVNSDLKWEKGKNWNIGLDFTLFDSKLSGSVNYFNRQQQDLLGDYDVATPPNIQTSSFVNVGTMKNTGIEIDLSFNAIKTKDFSYTLGVIGSVTDNKFVSFSNAIFKGQKYYWQDGFQAPGTAGPMQRIQEGERIGSYYTYVYAGVDEQGNWMIKNKEGDVIPIGDGEEEDKVKTGNGLPKFNLSLTNSFRYKDFDMSLFFRGNFGYQVYNVHEFYWGLQSTGANNNVLESAYKENGHIVTGMNQHNSYFVQDADYLKLDVATIGYTLKASSKWIQSARLYFTGRNLLTITKFDGIDPDVFPVNGLQPGAPSPERKNYYPSTRQYLVGVQLNF
ncbi:SusC/RagA family TonB-linked outer membrane protein [Bacteroidales bacterium]|nr:SusC/RagA family TonB-linked outer membrane protein [Bacteroidales bacterium]